ncbi:hypothetical protein MSC49_13860 [Methylosinus sp. C49]|nr:hypothetical protein MSC49_13860 [Methylosinus sp. C49]
MRSLSTSALGQPSETKETRGASLAGAGGSEGTFCMAKACHGARAMAIAPGADRNVNSAKLEPGGTRAGNLELGLGINEF